MRFKCTFLHEDSKVQSYTKSSSPCYLLITHNLFVAHFKKRMENSLPHPSS